VAQSEVFKLTPYLGTTVQLPLTQTLPIKAGQVIALTVPTWAPALAVGFDRTTAWRASRGKGTCDDTLRQTAQQKIRVSTQYRCLYTTAQLTFSATLISTP
jgi:hypothetical protein